MMRLLLAATMLLSVWTPLQQFGDARRWMEEGKPQRATEELEKMAALQPGDPWIIYNLGVAAYAAKDYRKADELWQKLAGMQLPQDLRDQVWFQIGNASYRIAEPAMKTEPDRSLAMLEQSREAFRIALSQNTEHPGASKNLGMVEQRLETLNADLATRLIAEARALANPEPAIEKLHAAQRYQQAAAALGPENPKYAAMELEIKELLADKYTVLATRLEERADRRVREQPDDAKERATARGEYERALADLQRAVAAHAKHAPAMEATPRVRGKLADLLAGNGRRSQREGNQLVEEKKAPEALGKYETALKSFDEALAISKDHKDALAGRAEVRKAMEELHLATGDRHLALGENQAKKDPGPASENLLKALDHFQQALGLNPANEGTKQRIERVNVLLPDVLAAFGKEDQKSAVEAEPESIPDAISYLERAEGTYTRALEIDPNHAPSKKGLEEVRAELERLRKKLPPPEKEKSPQPRARNARENLSSMLKKLRSQKKEQQEERNQRVRIIREGAGGSYRDW